MGRVTTYGEIALQLKIQNVKLKIDPRMVGWALHANNDPKVPCHRVVDRSGRLAPNFARLQRLERSDGGQAFDGATEQRRRLQAEGVRFRDEMHVDLETCLWNTTNITNGK